MNTFRLTIATPDGLLFEGEACQLTVRTTTGDLGVMAHHINCVAPLGMGRATVVLPDGARRYAACIGGMLSVVNGNVHLVPTTFEWAEDIDAARAAASEQRARQRLEDKGSDEVALGMAEARLKRALVRKSVASLAKSRN